MKRTSIFVVIFAASTSLHAEYYPSQYQITSAGFNHSKPLQKKLTTTRGELFFKETGVYIGASDVEYEDKVADKDRYELDTYAGIKKSLGLIGYHLGFKSYNRSLNKSLQVQEVYVGANLRDLSFSYATNEEGEYKQINLNHDISAFNLGLHLGKTTTLLGQVFTDWRIQASRTYKKIMFNAIVTKSEDPRLNETEFNLGVKKVVSFF